MSVIFSTDKCCFIDHEQFLDRIYSSCKVVKRNKDEMEGRGVTTRMKMKFNPNSFAIHLPFLMDSQVQKFISVSSNDEAVTNKPPTKKKRKRKCQHSNSTEEYYEQIKDILHAALEELHKIGSQMDLFRPVPLEVMATNNRDARDVAKRVQKQAETFAEIFILENSHPCGITEVSFNDTVIVDRLKDLFVNYNGEEHCIASIANNKFILPAKSSFFMSQLEHLPQLLKLGKSYDLIVLDPPWFNKSVKRKRGYSSLSKNDILKIPIKHLSKQGCIVAVWVTNSQSLLTFVQEELFPAWKLKYCATWHWVKITKSGKLTCSLDSLHKKPYEHVIIGRYDEESAKLDFQNHKVIFSVPSSIHSHKPPLHSILQPYMKEDSKNLELFARCLLPGWTSWGNEVLLLQHVDNYESYDNTDSDTRVEKSYEITTE